MKRATYLAIGFVLATVSLKAAPPQLAHMVFFTLEEDTAENQQKLVAACDEYLTGHAGTVYYSAGKIASELDREVNDHDFDVSLHLVFKDKAAHDKYQMHPRHLQFIEENKHLWSDVRVFDSYLAPTLTKLPKAAAGFAGMLRGKVVSKQRRQITFAVQAVTNVWRTNEADDPKTLVGRQVLVKGSKTDKIARFVKSLKVGEEVRLDVANKSGDVLMILELTEDQRERVKE